MINLKKLVVFQQEALFIFLSRKRLLLELEFLDLSLELCQTEKLLLRNLTQFRDKISEVYAPITQIQGRRDSAIRCYS